MGNLIHRGTALAQAFVFAAVKHAKEQPKASPKESWVRRRVVLNTDRPGFGVVSEPTISVHAKRSDTESATILKRMGYYS